MSPARSRRQKKQSFHEHVTRMKEPIMYRPKKSIYMISAVIATVLIGFSTYYVSSSPENSSKKRSLREMQREHQLQPLPVREMLMVQHEIDIARLWSNLIPILVERPPGSENIAAVKDHITTILRNLPGWEVEFDSFFDVAPQPYGKIKFNNIIASTNPSASRKLILACHYDSKILPGRRFVGATDSAVPCAMLLEIATALNTLLQEHERRQAMNLPDALDVALELIFFDGEEAFVQWTATDSIYGARHLARKWKRSNLLEKIDLFVLLDLIGHTGTQFANFRVTNTSWFQNMIEVENSLTQYGFLPEGSARVFLPDPNIYNRHSIEDDHIPFLREGVPIMHLISIPFPRVWHTVDDNLNALDSRRIELITRIITDFVAQYLHLRVPPK